MKNKPGVGSRLLAFMKMTNRLLFGLASKGSGLFRSYRLTRQRRPLLLDRNFTQHLTSLFVHASEYDSVSDASPSERKLCEEIIEETVELNRNNVTRTEAYWRIYRAYPELQWSLLAHLVSRNGGWSMTDLKGEWLPKLLDKDMIGATFDLLEACNSLIFGDAYPQLRLYAESKRSGRNLSYLLPRFGVTIFMRPFWDQFWLDQDPVPLTVALIVNEQNYIQKRVVEDEKYKNSVFSSLTFRSLALLQMNQVVFPMGHVGWPGHGIPMRLVGRVLENFKDLHERISFGKSLYGILFGYPEVHDEIIAFCEQAAHTGSRADYWPHRFTTLFEQKAGSTPLNTGNTAGHLLSSLWYSPPLTEAWPDRPIIPATKGDWFQSNDTMSELARIKLPRIIDITHEHVFGQNKLQTAVLLARSFMNGASRRRTGRG